LVAAAVAAEQVVARQVQEGRDTGVALGRRGYDRPVANFAALEAY
jgi:hypothetical protein